MGMKIKLATPLIALLFLFVNGYTQNDFIRMHPEPGKQYIYEFTESTYILTSDNEKQERSVRTKTYDIRFDNFEPENAEYLSVNIIKNTFERPDGLIPEYTDYRFPYFQEGFPNSMSPDFTETLLSRLTLKYRFDFETSKIELLNREELISEARAILNEKGFELEKIDNRIQDFRESILPETTTQIQNIFQVPEILSSGNEIDPEVFSVSKENNDSIALLNTIRQNGRTGLFSRTIVYDTNRNHLITYNVINTDSLSFPVWIEDERYLVSYTENRIHLNTEKDIQQNRFIISGKIEDSKYRKVTLAVLRSPFGTTLFEESVFLDENNSFQIETEITHSQLVYLQFGNYFGSDLPMLAFYAEPGSRIHFEARGSTFPWEVSFSGSFAGASKLLYDFRKEYNFFSQRLDWSTISILASNVTYADLDRTLNEYVDLFQHYENEMDDYVLDFVRDETEAFIFAGLINFLSLKEQRRVILNGRPLDIDISQQELSQMKSLLDTFNIYSIYNEYGIHSRRLAELYQSYFFRNSRMVAGAKNDGIISSIITSGYYSVANDLPNRVETAKNILAGHPLYSYLAGFLSNEKMSIENRPSWFEEYTQNQINNYYNLMIRVCNDNEFISSIRAEVDKHDKWEDDKYIPATEFYNENGEPAYMSDFFGDKPSVFYVTNNWSAERYHWDELAEKNPEINFVLIMEGSSLQEWMDYMQRAEPVAHQLFLLNGPKLRNIFKNNTKHFIVYDKDGERFAFASNMVTAKNLAKQALNGSKGRLDRSQLKVIILVLSITLLAFIFGILVWRWQIRQRLRKEEQQRRLRELELTAIRSQMNPHFLFNSLNSVQNLIQQNKGREAHLYLADFAGLIRKVLQNSEKEEVSLAEELAMTEQYLNLEKLRFEFDFSISVPDNVDTNNTMVPSLLLQPFTENAVIHGLQNKTESRNLKIEVSREDVGIKIVIEDNGIGREEAQKIAQTKNGKGSKLMRERLQILQEKQGEKYQLEIIDITGEETGTRVEILIPDEK